MQLCTKLWWCHSDPWKWWKLFISKLVNSLILKLVSLIYDRKINKYVSYKFIFKLCPNFLLMLLLINIVKDIYSGIVLAMGSANERRRYIVTLPLIGQAHTQNDPCYKGQIGDYILQHTGAPFSIIPHVIPQQKESTVIRLGIILLNPSSFKITILYF